MHRLQTDPDFIAVRRFKYSLKELEKKHPDGCPDRLVAAALNISEEELQVRMKCVIDVCRIRMGITKE
jgi:hypothetical protein